jgi:predicted aspartyl protease
MYVKGRLGNQVVEMLIDSGANISLVNYAVYDRLRSDVRPTLRRYGVPMVTADGTPMKVYGPLRK